MNKLLDSLHKKILNNDKFCAIVSEQEGMELVNAKFYYNSWVSVTQKLPDKDMWCLATFESGGIDKIQYLASQKWWNGEMGDNRVIAWQPLPEPYKECER